MAATGAAERDGEIAFALGNIVRDQVQQQAFDAAEEFAGLREGTDVASDAGIFAAEFPQARDEMRIGQKANIEDQVRIRGNAIAKAEADGRDEQRATAGILEAIDDELAQFVNVEFRGVDDDIGETANGRHAAAFEANALGDGIIGAERVRTAGFAEAAEQNFVAGFDEDAGGGMFGDELAINSGELFDLLAFAGVNEERGAFDFAAAFDVEFAESGDQADGKIIHAIKAEVFEGVQHRTFSGAGQASEDYELAGVTIAISGGAAAAGHGGFLTLDPSAVGAGNAEIFAIFRDGAARDLNAFLAEALGDLLVGERVRGVFIINHFFDAALEREQGHFAALRTVHGFTEKITELQDALRRVDVFIGYRAADGGRVHADLFGDFFDHHGLQVIGAVI